MAWERQLAELRHKLAIAGEQGGRENVARQHAKGRLTIRERIDGVLDEASFREIGPGAGGVERNEAGEIVAFSPANFVLGFGRIDGRHCVIGGEDFTLRGGSPCARASTPRNWRCSTWCRSCACTKAGAAA